MRRRSGRRRNAVDEAAPIFLMFLLFYVVPVVRTFQYAGMSDGGVHNIWDFSRYVELLRHPYYLLGLKNTLFFSLSGVALAVALGIGVAFLLCLSGKTMRYLQVLALTVFVPSACVAMVWGGMSGAASQTAGPALAFLAGMGLSPERLSVLSLFLWKNTGILVVVYVAAILQQPRLCYDAAATEGAKTRQLFRYITLPLLRPVIGAGSLYAFSLALKVYRETLLLFGHYPDPSVYTVMHFMNNHFQKLNYGTLAAGSLLFTALILLPFIPAIILWRARQR